MVNFKLGEEIRDSWRPILPTSLPVAQWLERPTGVRKVMGRSIPVGDSDFFFVPRSRHGTNLFLTECKNHEQALV